MEQQPHNWTTRKVLTMEKGDSISLRIPVSSTAVAAVHVTLCQRYGATNSHNRSAVVVEGI
jgi:hypothetical protein